ncbi:hypothetical protein B1748_23490 [Paenibacillus sp. MY03]|uniref:LPD38 domain-containing protein n=1 Tax=Paenibacillus sp. MY03 TaxID=302980 RepID=UPI000B3D35FD|nr:LPD38 domain-containing protein [Paenibacillus sp. MY03]OUS72975.1 hypothetical protein B1748_23490 [Paenibacillus sp. MY03]
MGKFDERRKQLGIAVTERPSSKTNSSSIQSGGGSRFDRRRQEIATQREEERQASIKRSEERQQPKRELSAMELQVMRDTLSGPSFSREKVTPQATSLPSPDNMLKQQYDRFQPTPEFEPVKASPLAKMLGLDKKPLIGPSLTNIAEMVTTDPILRGVSRGAAFGLGDSVMPQRTGKKPLSENISEFAGMLFPGAAAERVATTALKPVIGNLPRLGQYVARGIGAEALHGTAEEAAQEFGGLNNQTLGQRALDVGIQSAAGGALGAAADLVPKLFRGLSQKANDGMSQGSVRGAETQTAQMERIPDTPAPIERPKEAWFTRLFGNRGVGIRAGANDGRELIDTQITSNPREPLALMEQARELAERTNQDFVDRFAPFRKINEQTYDAAMDSTRSNNLANITIKDKFVDLEGNVIGNSLGDVYSAVPRGQKHIADRYLVARDAIDRMDRQIQVYGKEKWFPQTSQDAAALATKLEQQYPWLKQFGDEWNKFNRNRQDLWVQSGIASQDMVNRLRVSNPNYTPMFRQQPRRGLGGQLAINTGKSGFSGQKAPVKRAVGSGRKIIDPAQGMIETTASSYNAMLRNRAMQELYKALQANPDRYKGVMEIVEETADARQSTLKKINEALNDGGPDSLANLLNDEVNQLWKKAKQSGNTTDNIVTVMLEGNPVKMRVMDPSLLKAIDGINPVQLDGFMKLADIMSRGIKQSATGLLAPLQGARLALRDLPVAAAQSKDKVRFLGDLSHAFVSQIADWLPNFIPGSQRLGKLARDYYRAGGGYEAYLKGDSRVRSTASDIVNHPYLSGKNVWKQAKRFNPLRVLKGFGDMTENLPRIAAYSAEMRRAGWNRSPENVRRALDAGREATVNWSRRGSKSPGIEAVAPYTNAAVQGTYRFIKRIKEQPASAAALIASTAAAKIWAYEKYKDDPDYQVRSKFDKGIPYSKTEDGKFKSIPVEPTEAFIADQILNFYKWAMDQEELPNAKESIQSGIEAFAPSIISGPAGAFTSEGQPINFGRETAAKTFGGTVLDPLIAAGTGKNYFGGDIVPREYQDDPTILQYNETTSAPGRWAAENLGIDAFTFDYLSQKFGGDIAKIGLPLTSEVGRGDIEGNLIDQVNSRLKLLEDPVMRNTISDDYYKALEKVSDAKAISDKRDTPLPNWYQTAYDEVTSMKKNSLNKAISDFNAMKKEITRDTTLSAKERADQLRDVQRNINMLRIQGIKRLEELGVPQ